MCELQSRTFCSVGVADTDHIIIVARLFFFVFNFFFPTMSSHSVAHPRKRQLATTDQPRESSPDQGEDLPDSLPSEQHAWAAQVSEHIRQESAAGSSFGATFRSRATVLVTLMIMQSFTGLILSSFEELVQDNVVITLFLTMLVGAGGNAGNQVRAAAATSD